MACKLYVRPYLGMITASFTLNCELASATFVSRLSLYISKPIWSFYILFLYPILAYPPSSFSTNCWSVATPVLQAYPGTSCDFSILFLVEYDLLLSPMCLHRGLSYRLFGTQGLSGFSGSSRSFHFSILSWVQRLSGRQWLDWWMGSELPAPLGESCGEGADLVFKMEHLPSLFSLSWTEPSNA